MEKASLRDQDFARGMREAREDRGLSQQAVADQMSQFGYDWVQTTVYKAENGNRKVSVGEASALADVFGIPVASMLEGSASTLSVRFKTLTESASGFAAGLLDLDKRARYVFFLESKFLDAVSNYSKDAPDGAAELIETMLDEIRPLLGASWHRQYSESLHEAFEDINFRMTIQGLTGQYGTDNLPWIEETDE